MVWQVQVYVLKMLVQCMKKRAWVPLSKCQRSESNVPWRESPHMGVGEGGEGRTNLILPTVVLANKYWHSSKTCRPMVGLYVIGFSRHDLSVQRYSVWFVLACHWTRVGSLSCLNLVLPNPYEKTRLVLFSRTSNKFVMHFAALCSFQLYQMDRRLKCSQTSVQCTELQLIPHADWNTGSLSEQ